ncbi:hypothetical protein [Cylindrospermopsis raciborskii]|uniref:hypothetical protein n=1 Tax=Cylindrospermopsis raciborskii TaxID=77022 RepID=UPI00387917CE
MGLVGDRITLPVGDREALPTGDCEALPLGARSPIGTFHVRFLVGKRLTVNVFRQRINQLFQGVGIFGGGLRSTPFGRLRSTRAREIVFRKSPPASSQEKILNVLRGDRIAFPAGSRITLPRRDPM